MNNNAAALEGSNNGASPAPRTVMRALRRWWQARARSVDHVEVLNSIDADGSLRSNYLFMCVMSAGIAITGLLLNSPAVIIGAMLVSPLMGPIVRVGLGVTTLDYRRVAGGGLALVGGMGLALLMSMLIVGISPIREITPEILARTRPNLFDLLVATLSGLAGGYAMVRGRGGAIVGVAIATALMPPMAVVGYGLASGQFPIARGALLLFVTNLVAIALSVTAITTWYGFSRRAWRKAVVWQSGLAALLIIPLLLPLFSSLQAITREAQLQKRVRESIRDELAAHRFRIIGLSVAVPSAEQVNIDLTLAIDSFSTGTEDALRQRLITTVGGPIALRLTPVIMAEPERPAVADSALANPVTFSSESIAPQPALVDPMQALIDAFPLPLTGSRIDAGAQQLTLVLEQVPELGLAAMQRIERELNTRHAPWKVRLIPPAGRALRVHFTVGTTEIDPVRREDLDRAVWALQRWGVAAVTVEGRASSDGDGPAPLAQRRAELVADLLRQQGFVVNRAEGRYPYPMQADLEARAGKDVLRSVLILPGSEEIDIPVSE